MPRLHRALLFAGVAICGASCGSTNAAPQMPSSVVDTISPGQVGQEDAPRSIGLNAQEGSYRLDVVEVSGRGGQAIMLDITKNGEPLRKVESNYMHVFAIGEDLSYVMHEPRSEWSSWMNVYDTGETRVVVSFRDDGAEVLLGATLNVTEGSDFSGLLANPTQTEMVHASGVIVERDGWDFEVTGSRSEERSYDYGAWLTIIRETDLAVTTQSLDQVGDGVYSFDPALPGPGEYLAMLEVTGAPVFSFFVAIDADGNFIEREETDLIEAVESFVGAVANTDVEATLNMMSARCRSVLSPSIAEDLALYSDPATQHWLTSVVADLTGETATVEYVIIEGDYTPGETPFWQSRFESWVFETDGWRRDVCETGYFEW